VQWAPKLTSLSPTQEVIEKHDVEEVRAPVIFTEKGTLRAGSLEKVIEWVCSKPLTANTNRNVNVSPFPLLSVWSYNPNEALVSLTYPDDNC
jgi:hypothetical protein